MTKYTVDDKLSAVKHYLDGEESYISIGRSMGTSESVIMNWVKQYEYHGVEGLCKKSYTNYTAQFKLDVLNYMNDNGTSPNETAVIFNIPSPATIRTWRILFKKGGVDALEPKKKERTLMTKEDNKKKKKETPTEGSLEDLKAELEQLRMENAYLKKLNALVQNKEKSPNKTKRK
jgi:transposase